MSIWNHHLMKAATACGIVTTQCNTDVFLWEQAADIIILEEHDAKGMMRAYPNKTFVALQTNAAAAMLLCGPGGGCATFVCMFSLITRSRLLPADTATASLQPSHRPSQPCRIHFLACSVFDCL